MIRTKETTFQTECGQLLDSICANCDLEVRWCSLGALDRVEVLEYWTGGRDRIRGWGNPGHVGYASPRKMVSPNSPNHES